MQQVYEDFSYTVLNTHTHITTVIPTASNKLFTVVLDAIITFMKAFFPFERFKLETALCVGGCVRGMLFK